MSKILLINSKEVRKARQHHALKGKRLIASGMFSGVFEGSRPDTVLKLTICSATHSLLTDEECQKSIHAPKLIVDYGKVGDFLTGTNIIETKITKPVKCLVPMYLVEIERLQKSTAHPHIRKIASQINKVAKTAILSTLEGESCRDNQAKALIKLLEHSKLLQQYPTLLSYFQSLNSFVAKNRNAFYDLHLANIMANSDGTLVFADPVGSNDIYETQGLFAGVKENNDVNWSEVKRDHQERFGHLKKI